MPGRVCGSCAMNINGKVGMACSALVDKLGAADQARSDEEVPAGARPGGEPGAHVRRAQAGEGVDPARRHATHLGPGPKMSQDQQAQRYVLSTCITCGSCFEACPQVSVNNNFLGAARHQPGERLFHLHPTGAMQRRRRLRGLMGKGGIQDCGKAQNCVAVCPKEIPLTNSIAQMNREVTKQLVKDLFFKDSDQGHKVGGPG